MASKGLNFGDVIPRIAKTTTIKASANLDNLIKIKLKKIPEREAVARFERAINRASTRIAQDLQGALSAAMASGVWSGEDLIDTGELMNSGNVSVTADGITISYDAPYAALVHYGGYIHPYGNINARVYLPPRPWVESVLFGGGPVQRFDFESYYIEEIRAEFS